MVNNVFEEKQDFLLKVREDVLERDSLQSEIAKMKAQHKKLEKSIAIEEKQISDEINSTIKKRKLEIEETYDDRLDDNRSRKKSVASKRNKKKSQRINKRIEEETKDVRDNTRDLRVEMKTLLKKNKTPSICKISLYYIMFIPRGIDEVLLMFISFAIYFAGIPCGIMLLVKQLLLKDNKSAPVWCVVIVCAVVILQLIIYFAVFSATRTQHKDVIDQARSIRDKMKANKRQISAIKNSINKDKDESKYNLDAYDEKLDKLDQEADQIGKEKLNALKVFHEETKQLIIDEINGRRLQTVNDMKAEKENTEYNISELEKRYSDKVLFITQNYASYIGEEMCKADKIAALINLMEEGQANTVSEAISIMKNN